MSGRETVITVIHQEHASLMLVLQALDRMLASVTARHTEADFALFAAALLYIDDFQERCHHPKEEDFLFKAMLARTPSADAAIARLRAEHIGSAQDVQQLHRLLVRYLGGSPGGLADFHLHVGAYCARMHEHMRTEERLLDAAAAHLTGEDWRRIANAFLANDDPLFGGRRAHEYAQLYQRIAVLMPRKLKPALRRGSRAPSVH